MKHNSTSLNVHMHFVRCHRELLHFLISVVMPQKYNMSQKVFSYGGRYSGGTYNQADVDTCHFQFQRNQFPLSLKFSKSHITRYLHVRTENKAFLLSYNDKM